MTLRFISSDDLRKNSNLLPGSAFIVPAEDVKFDMEGLVQQRPSLIEFVGALCEQMHDDCDRLIVQYELPIVTVGDEGKNLSEAAWEFCHAFAPGLSQSGVAYAILNEDSILGQMLTLEFSK